MEFQKAIEAIRSGRPILVYDFDDRERECDLTIASQFITPDILRMMRHDAGGLVCTTMPYGLAEDLGLPFMSDVFWYASEKYDLLRAMAPTDIPYDRTKSSFGVTINHRDTYTGITDHDRALTIKEFSRIIFQDLPADDIRVELGRNFRAPGHVHLLNTTERILQTRRGHTELCTAMMYMAGVSPSATICEMMADDGGSMKKEDVRRFADANGIPLVDGTRIIEEWDSFTKRTGLEV